jgi:hypothetical protein
MRKVLQYILSLIAITSIGGEIYTDDSRYVPFKERLTYRTLDVIKHAQRQLLDSERYDADNMSKYINLLAESGCWYNEYCVDDTIYLLEPTQEPYQALIWASDLEVYYTIDSLPTNGIDDFGVSRTWCKFEVLAAEPVLHELINRWDIKEIKKMKNKVSGAPDFILTRCIVKDSVVSEIECHIIAHPYNWYTPGTPRYQIRDFKESLKSRRQKKLSLSDRF